jgi:Arc/MetJ-type ribon-helix-helix transcriptional regulator
MRKIEVRIPEQLYVSFEAKRGMKGYPSLSEAVRELMRRFAEA